MRTLPLLLLAALLAPGALADPNVPPLPRATLRDNGDGTYVLLVDACEPPVLADCAYAVPLLPRAPGVFPTLHPDGATVYTSLDCQHRLPTHGVRESDCGSVSLSPTARAALRPTSDGWYYVDAKVCAHYTGWMCAWHGALPLPDPRGWPGLVQPYARANPDGTYTVGEDCRILMPWPLSGQSCSASYTVKPDFVLVTPRRTWDGVTTDTYACRAYAAPTLGYACTYAGEGPNAHAWVYGDDDGSADPDVRVCTAGWSWCPVNKRVDLPPVLP